MVELYDEFFSMLRFAKQLYDSGLEDQVKGKFGLYPLDGDIYWEIAYEAIGGIFQDTRQYYNDDDEIETWVFSDPLIDRFCQLCQEYEARRDVHEEEDPFRRDMEHILHEGFCFSGYAYNYDWRLSPNDRGRKCLLLFLGCEFCSHDEIPTGLLDIKDGFKDTIRRLEQELSKETRIIPLSLVTAARQKEAA